MCEKLDNIGGSMSGTVCAEKATRPQEGRMQAEHQLFLRQKRKAGVRNGGTPYLYLLQEVDPAEALERAMAEAEYELYLFGE